MEEQSGKIIDMEVFEAEDECNLQVEDDTVGEVGPTEPTPGPSIGGGTRQEGSRQRSAPPASPQQSASQAELTNAYMRDTQQVPFSTGLSRIIRSPARIHQSRLARHLEFFVPPLAEYLFCWL